METKICPHCHTEKNRNEFSMAGKRLSSYCRQCTNNLLADRYHKHRAIIDELKDVPCLDCGLRFPPECMDFDHQENKKFTISSCISLNLKKVLAEIEKCDIICANCHRIRTKKNQRETMLGSIK